MQSPDLSAAGAIIGIFATAFSMSWFNTSTSLLASYILHLEVYTETVNPRQVSVCLVVHDSLAILSFESKVHTSIHNHTPYLKTLSGHRSTFLYLFHKGRVLIGCWHCYTTLAKNYLTCNLVLSISELPWQYGMLLLGTAVILTDSCLTTFILISWLSVFYNYSD